MTERCGVSVALVTGRARIGRTTIERLASEVALLAFCELDTDVGEKTQRVGRRRVVLRLRHRRSTAPSRCRGKASAEHGDVPVVINAGGYANVQYGRCWVKPFVDVRTPMTAEQACELSPRLRYIMDCNANAPVRGLG